MDASNGIVEIRDHKIFIALMASGIAPVNVIHDDGVLFFCFDESAIKSTLDRYMSGKPFVVDIFEVWRAQDIFKSHLNNRRRG